MSYLFALVAGGNLLLLTPLVLLSLHQAVFIYVISSARLWAFVRHGFRMHAFLFCIVSIPLLPLPFDSHLPPTNDVIEADYNDFKIFSSTSLSLHVVIF